MKYILSELKNTFESFKYCIVHNPAFMQTGIGNPEQLMKDKSGKFNFSCISTLCADTFMKCKREEKNLLKQSNQNTSNFLIREKMG
ncbi:unnamed protein product [Brugia timori]|uniref:CHCH domain-containing protein n=1 Tax=Brugia timori TaxID=42155 RepID=A0A0R3QPE1_9BILA|nr:unnamed protein product [Brugia timori]